MKEWNKITMIVFMGLIFQKAMTQEFISKDTITFKSKGSKGFYCLNCDWKLYGSLHSKRL